MSALLLLVGSAFAGTLRIHSDTPVSFRVDGVWIGRMVTDAEVEVSDGRHLVEVCDVVGTVIGSADVSTGPDPVWLEYDDHRVDRVNVGVDAPMQDPNDLRPTITAEEFLELERDLARGNDKARLKVVSAAAGTYWFEMRHVDSLLSAFDDLNPRIEAAILLSYKTVDPWKFAAIEDHFPPGLSRDKVRAAFNP